MFKRFVIAVAWFVILLASLVCTTTCCRMVTASNDAQALSGVLGIAAIAAVNLLYGFFAIREMFRA